MRLLAERVKHGRPQADADESCLEPKCTVCLWQRQSVLCIDPQAGTASCGAAEHHCDPRKAVGPCEETRRGGDPVATRNLGPTQPAGKAGHSARHDPGYV